MPDPVTKTLYSFKRSKKYPNFPIVKEVPCSSTTVLDGETFTGTDTLTYVAVGAHTSATKILGYEKTSDMEFDTTTVTV